MINTRKIALLVDVDNVKIGGEAFNELYTKLNEIGDVVYCKFYGYNDRKHIYLSEAIAKYGYETSPFMRYKKRFSQLDIRIIVDAIKLNYTKTEIDTYCIVAGDGDLIPLLVELKSCGRTLIDINTPYQEQNYHMFDAHINLKSLGNAVETYLPKTKKTVSVKKSPSIIVEPKPAPVAKTKKVVKEEVEEVVKQTVKEQPSGPANPMIISNISELLAEAAEEKKANAAETPKIETPVQKVEPYIQETYEEEEEEDTIELGDILRDITNRYTELDFSDNSDMNKKIKLINDIEQLIKTETAKGEGLKSKNADVRQIFVELQNIVEDMKNAI